MNAFIPIRFVLKPTSLTPWEYETSCTGIRGFVSVHDMFVSIIGLASFVAASSGGITRFALPHIRSIERKCSLSDAIR